MTDKEVELLLPNYDPATQAGDCVFENETAMRAVRFFSLFLKHHTGKWSGQPFHLSDWQISIVANMFGWIRPDGTRRFRHSLIELPRKSGKSNLVAGLGLYCLVADNENSAEVYTCASTRDQAALVFRMAKRFVEADEYLSKKCKIYRNSIVVEETGSSMKALSSESGTAHGLNSSTVIVGELHVWCKPDSRDLFEALQTSQGARAQPLFISITTAGTAEPSLWKDLHQYAERVAQNEVTDMTFMPCIWAAKHDDKWDDPEVWKRVNPSLGSTVSLEFYEQECNKAKALPSYQHAFRRLYLNQPTTALDRWLDMEAYNSCEPRMSEEELVGRTCFAGLDLSSTLDLTSLVLAFPRTLEEGGGYDVLPYFFVPKENMARRERDDGVPFQQWASSGDEFGKYLHATTGDVVDYQFVRKLINELAESYDIREIAIDRWNSTSISIQLSETDGKTVAYFGQGYRSLSAPAKELEACICGKRFRHGDHPVLKWCASVCGIDEDAAGNIKPSKKRSGRAGGRIDGIVASTMAIGRAIATTGDSGESVYEDRGLELL